MEKRQLIDDIRRLNTSATTQFLRQFDADSLREYLSHLEAAHTRSEARARAASARISVHRQLPQDERAFAF
jgi:hypothetical protein